MPKKVEMYEADDGKMYKTSKGAENHNKRIMAKSVIENLGLDEYEVLEKLKEVSKVNKAVKMILRVEPDWTKWPTYHMKLINKELLDSINKKTTKFVYEVRTWGKVTEEEIATEKKDDFVDPELHVGDEYKVDRVEDVNEYIKKVYYKDKYSPLEIMEMKLDKGEKLTSGELSMLVHEYPEEHRVEGEDRRWSRTITSVVNVDGTLYAIDWEHGLTESQENEYYDQPVKVVLEEKEVTITKTIIKEI